MPVIFLSCSIRNPLPLQICDIRNRHAALQVFKQIYDHPARLCSRINGHSLAKNSMVVPGNNPGSQIGNRCIIHTNEAFHALLKQRFDIVRDRGIGCGAPAAVNRLVPAARKNALFHFCMLFHALLIS